MTTMSGLTQLPTPSGVIPFPAYIPVTTFGQKYPLDDLIRPYLRRLASAVMVSMHYAKQMRSRPNLPLLIDSGGFASLFANTTIKRVNGLGILEITTEDGTELTDPMSVLDFQEEHADVAFTLDFPIPPATDNKERISRLELTVMNALWAIENRRRRDMPLFACVQGWDAESYRSCAMEFAAGGFDGVAIGGLVPRMHSEELLFGVVDAVREAIPDLPIHIFGLGKPGLVEKLFERGIQSVDSSAYVKLAARGQLWTGGKMLLDTPSPAERLQLALSNLAIATETALPLRYSSKITEAENLLRSMRTRVSEMSALAA